MDRSHNEWAAMLLRLRAATEADFAGFAVPAQEGRIYRWICVSGSISGRCEAMTFRKGQGVGGQALRIGSPVVWPAGAAETARLRRECPLMLTEALCAAVAAPVRIDGEWAGVLAIGSRGDRPFRLSDTAAVKREAEHLVHRYVTLQQGLSG